MNRPEFGAVHYAGLTPLGVSEWLRITPASEWPTTFAGLRQMDLGQWVVDWLEFAVANQGANQHPERQVVEAFLHIMSKRATHEALAHPESLLGALKFTAQRMGGMFASNSTANPVSINLTLIESMLAVLDGMTASVWPDRVFSLSSAIDEVCNARESANAA